MVTRLIKQAASGNGGIFIVTEDSADLLKLEDQEYEIALMSLQLTPGQSASLADAKASEVKMTEAHAAVTEPTEPTEVKV